MKVNLKLRLQNKQFIIAIVSAVLLLVGQIAELFGYAFNGETSQAVMATVNTVLSILVAVGVVQDPTTSGLSDDEEVLATEKLG